MRSWAELLSWLVAMVGLAFGGQGCDVVRAGPVDGTSLGGNLNAGGTADDDGLGGTTATGGSTPNDGTGGSTAGLDDSTGGLGGGTGGLGGGTAGLGGGTAGHGDARDAGTRDADGFDATRDGRIEAAALHTVCGFNDMVRDAAVDAAVGTGICDFWAGTNGAGGVVTHSFDDADGGSGSMQFESGVFTSSNTWARVRTNPGSGLIGWTGVTLLKAQIKILHPGGLVNVQLGVGHDTTWSFNDTYDVGSLNDGAWHEITYRLTAPDAVVTLDQITYIVVQFNGSPSAGVPPGSGSTALIDNITIE